MISHFTINKQHYPAHDGSRPESWAVWLHRRWHWKRFCAYSWSRQGAEKYVAQLERQQRPYTESQLLNSVRLTRYVYPQRQRLSLSRRALRWLQRIR